MVATDENQTAPGRHNKAESGENPGFALFESQTVESQTAEAQTGAFVLRFHGKMSGENGAAILKRLEPAMNDWLKSGALRHLTVDIRDVFCMDDFGALAVSTASRMAASKNVEVDIAHAGGRFLDLMVCFDSTRKPGVASGENRPFVWNKKQAVDGDKKKGSASVRRLAPGVSGILERVGERVANAFLDGKKTLSFLGEVVMAFCHICAHPKSFRFRDMILCMEKTGVKALPVAAVTSLLLGLIMAFMSALQLRQFGANLYVASLVALSMVSELGPVITAIIVAGRTGSAFAAEIGAMKISEEIDALFIMGFNAVLFLAIPRIVASVIVVPILTIFANLFAILGGLLIGVAMLDLTPGSYMAQTIESLDFFEFSWGFAKSLVFALIISWVGCLRGFQTKGSAEEVGAAATSTMVTCIFLIILVDSVFAIIRYYWS